MPHRLSAARAGYGYREPLTTQVEDPAPSGEMRYPRLFPKGKKHDNIIMCHLNSPDVVSMNRRQFHQDHCYYSFSNPFYMFFMQY